MSYVGSLLTNVHEGLALEVEPSQSNVVRGVYDYFHYCCDGFDDKGWGCGYRTLQTICSWILHERNCENVQFKVPSILSIQEALVIMEDKPSNFLNSREWIGSVEVGFVLNHMYNVDFRILHVWNDQEWDNAVVILANHFKNGGSPVMMGGRTDASSKCIVGTHGNSHLLIVDPHFVGKAKNSKQLQELGMVHWQHISDFLRGSFYNMCLPQVNLDV